MDFDATQRRLDDLQVGRCKGQSAEHKCDVTEIEVNIASLPICQSLLFMFPKRNVLLKYDVEFGNGRSEYVIDDALA